MSLSIIKISILCAIILVSFVYLYLLNSRASAYICDGKQIYTDAIMIFPDQISHNSNQNENIYKILSFLAKRYPSSTDADILVWGDNLWRWRFPRAANNLNIRLCSFKIARSLNSAKSSHNQTPRTDTEPIFYYRSIWNILHKLNYLWVMRLDINSEIVSKVRFNMFDVMRRERMLYGYRTLSQGCDDQLSQWLQTHLKVNKDHNAIDVTNYCSNSGRYTYNNNFYISKVAWWLELKQLALMDSIHLGSERFTYMSGSMYIQSLILHLNMPRDRIKHFIEWTHSVRQVSLSPGLIAGGWIESGTRDDVWQSSLRRFSTDHSSPWNHQQYERCQHPQQMCANFATCFTYLLKIPVSTDVTAADGVPLCEYPTSVPTPSALYLPLPVASPRIEPMRSRMLVMGLTRSVQLENLRQSMRNLLSIMMSERDLLVLIGVSEASYNTLPPGEATRVSWLKYVVVEDLHITVATRTAMYSKLRNQVYLNATRSASIDSFDYVIVSDMDMEYPITTIQWQSCFSYSEPWDVMTANGILDRTHTYYDIFAYRDLNVPYHRSMEKLNPDFGTYYGKSWDWVVPVPMFEAFTRVRAAHGGLSIYNGATWRRAVRDTRPFDESIAYDVCEHVPLQEMFPRIYVNPHLVFYHASPSLLPFDTYYILLHRNGGFFSNINSLIAALSTSSRFYPLWSKVAFLKGTDKDSSHFSYLGDGAANGYLHFFEEVKYTAHDMTMASAHFKVIPPKRFQQFYSSFPADLLFPWTRPFWSPKFSDFRRFYHGIYQRFIHPKPTYLLKAKSIISSEYTIGVHLRNPVHFVETGTVYMRQYYSVIDKTLTAHPDAKIFLASDTSFCIQAFLERYGDRVVFHRGVQRASLDLLFEVFYRIGSGNATLDPIGQLVTKNGKSVGSELHSTQQSSKTLGEEVLIDTLSLSYCNEFIGISSNIALAVSYINPNISMHILKGGVEDKL